MNLSQKGVLQLASHPQATQIALVRKVPEKACLTVSMTELTRSRFKGTYHSREVLTSFAWYIMIAKYAFNEIKQFQKLLKGWKRATWRGTQIFDPFFFFLCLLGWHRRTTTFFSWLRGALTTSKHVSHWLISKYISVNPSYCSGIMVLGVIPTN